MTPFDEVDIIGLRRRVDERRHVAFPGATPVDESRRSRESRSQVCGCYASSDWPRRLVSYRLAVFYSPVSLVVYFAGDPIKRISSSLPNFLRASETIVERGRRKEIRRRRRRRRRRRGETQSQWGP